MRKLLTLLLFIISFQTLASDRLNGKKFLFKYQGEQHYQVQFSKSKVRWECVKGDELGKSETDEFKSSLIAEDVYFIQWTEVDGTFVALTINLKTNKIISAGVSGAHRWFRRGNVARLTL